MTRYLTERALQLYYYTEILGKHVDFDHKALIKKLLSRERMQTERRKKTGCKSYNIVPNSGNGSSNMDNLRRSRRAKKQRKQKKKKEKRDRTRSLQKCQRDGYDRMEEWWQFVKGCETLHNQKISKISTTTTSTSTSPHHNIFFSTINITPHNITRQIVNANQ